MDKKIAMSSDHAGFELKNRIFTYLTSLGFFVKDFGTYSSESCDYPDYAHPMSDAVENNEFDLGITICGSGNGINMTANKHQKIRSALCWLPEIAELARLHNDANVCSLPARFITYETAVEIINKFLNTEFEGGRHINRVNKIPLNK